ncbi:DUF6207 family protein [Streptomyces rubradiris]|uniref:DUF6207 family protein n=1 Tax=Streptomyces rubradiris TaxID=285531 RepID=UPI0036F0F052
MRPPTAPPRSPSSSCSPTGGRRRAEEHTTRDAGEPGVWLRCYLDLRQLPPGPPRPGTDASRWPET